MSIKEQYKIINDILWGLKPFEVGFTFTAIIGIFAFIFGAIPVSILEYAVIMRVILFPLRILIVSQKRELEKENPGLVPKKINYQWNR
jgi:hypothetical protein